MKIKFCGAARCVTGSCHLVNANGKNILLDCGMRQGADKKTELGEGEFPFDAASIDAVLLSHAHIDHSGLLPLLVKKGFKGKVITTKATAELSGIMLPDSGHIQESDAEYQNRKNMRAGKPLVEPLYTMKDVEETLKRFSPVSYGQVVTVAEGVTARFNDIGHLLGSAAIELWAEEEGKTTKLVFSGDIGRSDRPIICDPKQVQGADYLIIEGTYGDRNHQESSDEAKEAELISVLKMGIARGGNIVIPSFAVGRTQELLYYIKRLLLKNAVPGLEKVPVYIDSPLGINATNVYRSCAEGYYDEEARAIAKSDSPFEFDTLRIARTADESKLINAEKGCNIIISSSGMCDAGRIRHHLKHNLFRADSTVVFSGYQAVGTLGRILLDGAKKVKLFGESIFVNAAIERIEGFSGHAGRDELIRWIEGIGNKPNCIFLVHGEEEALASYEKAVKALGYRVEVPSLLEEYTVFGGTCCTSPQEAPAPVAKQLEEAHHVAKLQAEAARLGVLIEHTDWESDASAEMLAGILEADIRTLVDKWENILRQ
ncbi:MAG: MBL fold metallo-hydrolase [Clostridiales bacterium]|nr:MBL fold metallo-hydrolase [Clostridiales bacterium]